MIFSRGQPKAAPAAGGAKAALREGDLAYVTPVRAAQVVEAAPAAMWAVYLMLLVLLVAVLWAAVAQVDVIARANARVIPEGREQVIASLEGGILRELSVREGQQVAEGEDLALLDPTRFEAQQAEGQAKRLALRATMARLQAESARPAAGLPRRAAWRSRGAAGRDRLVQRAPAGAERGGGPEPPQHGPAEQGTGGGRGDVGQGPDERGRGDARAAPGQRPAPADAGARQPLPPGSQRRARARAQRAGAGGRADGGARRRAAPHGAEDRRCAASSRPSRPTRWAAWCRPAPP